MPRFLVFRPFLDNQVSISVWCLAPVPGVHVLRAVGTRQSNLSFFPFVSYLFPPFSFDIMTL